MCWIPLSDGRCVLGLSTEIRLDTIPAWSLHRLIEIIPLYFLETKMEIRHHGVANAIKSGNNLYDEIITLIGDCIKHGMFNKEYLEE